MGCCCAGGFGGDVGWAEAGDEYEEWEPSASDGGRRDDMMSEGWG